MKRDEYYIGLTGSRSRSSGYRRRKRRNKKKIAFRALIISICVLLLIAITVGVVCLVSAIGSAVKGDGDNGKPETVPLVTASSDNTATDASLNTTASVEVTTVPETTASPQDTVLVFNKPNIKDDGTDGHLISDSIYIRNNKAYNIFGSSDKIAKNYSSAVNYIAKKLGKDVTVYNIVVPNQTEFGLPSRIVESLGGQTQDENIKTICKNLSKDVKPINCYNALSAHCDEYIYYGTDHHWTSLGAYYAYEAFCQQTGQAPMKISDKTSHKIEGFTGAFWRATSSSELYSNPDTVIYYDLPYDTYADHRSSPGDEMITVGVYYPAAPGDLTYGAFCWGDVSEFIIHSECNTGRKIAVIKDSYGNAFAPYLSANYDEVHMIDFRFWKGELISYLKSNGITEVLILNNTMSANTPTQVAMMKDLVG